MKTLYHARLYTSEEDRETHFEDVPVDLERESLEDRLPFSIPMTAEDVCWFAAPQDWKSQKPHPGSRMLYVTLKGEYQVRASDGQTRTFPVGSVLLLDELLDDGTGAGHSTEVISPGGVVVLAVALRSRSHPDFRD